MGKVLMALWILLSNIGCLYFLFAICFAVQDFEWMYSLPFIAKALIVGALFGGIVMGVKLLGTPVFLSYIPLLFLLGRTPALWEIGLLISMVALPIAASVMTMMYNNALRSSRKW